MSSLRRYGLQPVRLLSPWDSPGKNTGMSHHAVLQGIFLTQGLNLRLRFSITSTTYEACQKEACHSSKKKG